MSKTWIQKKASILLLGGVLLSSGFTTGFTSFLGHDVELIQGTHKTKITTYSGTVEDFIKSQGITLEKGDVVKPALTEKIDKNMEIKVLKPKTQKINIHGEVKDYFVAGELVEDILAQSNITLQEGDQVTPGLKETVNENQIITITRGTSTIVEKTREIPFTTITKQDPSLVKGQEKVIQEGQKGLVKEKIQQKMVGKQVVGAVVMATETVKEPIPKILAQGTKEEPNTIHGKKYIKKIVMQGTAYDPSAGSKTAMGTRARVGAVAVDPRVIPLGTKLYIESMDGFPTYGFAVAEDTGGAIKGNRIDVFYNTNREANRFGRRNVLVYVLAE